MKKFIVLLMLLAIASVLVLAAQALQDRAGRSESGVAAQWNAAAKAASANPGWIQRLQMVSNPDATRGAPTRVPALDAARQWSPGRVFLSTDIEIRSIKADIAQAEAAGRAPDPASLARLAELSPPPPPPVAAAAPPKVKVSPRTERDQIMEQVRQAKQEGRPVDPQWIERLGELPPAHTSPLELQIRELEQMLGNGQKVLDPADYRRIKERLNELYAQRPENSPNNSLDQGGDNCSDVTVIPSVPYTDSGTTSGRANDFTPGCVYSAAPDVIYRFTASCSGEYTVSLCGSSYDTGLELRTGGACPGTETVACNDDACGLQSQVTAWLTAGVTYYIIVDGYWTNAGSYTMSVTADCQTACVDLAMSAPGTISGNTCNAGDDCDLRSGTEQIVEVYIPYSSNWTFSLCDGPAWDTYMFLSGSCCGPVIASNDDYCGVLSRLSDVPLQAGTYYVTIEPYSMYACGPFTLDVTAPAAGCVDDVLNAPGTVSGSTCGAGDDCGLRAGDDRNIRVTLPSAGNWTFSLCNSPSWDTYLFLSSQCCGAPAFTQNDDYCGVLSEVTLTLAAGEYYVDIEPYYPGTCGDFTLSVTLSAEGRCCYGDLTAPTCQENITPQECDVLGGYWDDGSCAQNPCVAVPPCPAGAIFSQVVFPTSPDWGAFSFRPGPKSQVGSSTAYENFGGLTQPIGSVRFWGFGYLDEPGSACLASPWPFRIEIYGGEAPVQPLRVTNVSITPTPTGLYYYIPGAYEFPLWQFEAELDWGPIPPLLIENGWISVQGAAPNCDFHWCLGPSEDNDWSFSYEPGGPLSHMEYGLGVCLLPYEGCTPLWGLVPPGSITDNTCNFGNLCDLRPGRDLTIGISIPTAGNWTFSLCEWQDPGFDTYMYLSDQCCGGNIIAENDDYCGLGSRIACVPLESGDYYLTLESYHQDDCGIFTLHVLPCIGACCLPDVTCQSVSPAECAALGGMWLPDVTCATVDCPEPPACPTGAMFSHLPYPPTWDNLYLPLSDMGNDWGWPLENFSGIQRPVGSIRFWGFGAAAEQPCAETPWYFHIEVFTDAGGIPGTLSCSYDVTLNPVNTNFQYFTFPLWQFDAVLSPACALTSGWISIRGMAGTGCAFYWMDAPSQDSQWLMYIPSAGYQPYDQGLAVCLNPDPCVDAVLAPGLTLQGTTCNAGDHCSLVPGADYAVQLDVPHDGSWTIHLCETEGPMWDPLMYLTDQCCTGSIVAQNDDFCALYPGLVCMPLAAGTYYLVIEPYDPTSCGQFTLAFGECAGACCLPTETCEVTTQAACLAMNGTWYPNGSCEPATCLPPPECPTGAVVSQRPNQPGLSSAQESDLAHPYAWPLENFSGITGQISSLRFWGFQMAEGIACSEEPQDFEIAFYSDAGGIPGTFVRAYQLSLTGTPGQTHGGVPLWQFDALLHPPLSMSTGWFYIRGGGDPACRFYWVNSAQGDDLHFLRVEGMEYWPYNGNLAFCLGTLACQDMYAMCPTGQFIPELPFVGTGNTHCYHSTRLECTYESYSSPYAVYQYAPQSCAVVTASLCGSLFDTELEIWEGTPCPGLTQVACNDDYPCAQGTRQSQLTFTAQGGTVYFIRVTGHGANGGPAMGEYTLTVTGTPCAIPAPVVVAHFSAGVLRLHWNGVPGATSYVVRHADSPDGPFTDLATTAQTTVEVPTSASVKRFYHVVAQTGVSN